MLYVLLLVSLLVSKSLAEHRASTLVLTFITSQVYVFTALIMYLVIDSVCESNWVPVLRWPPLDGEEGQLHYNNLCLFISLNHSAC